jgi:hypothetical protein
MELKGDYNLPKKGNLLKVKDNYQNINFHSEVIDKINFNSVTLTISGWFIINTDYKPQRKVEKLLQQIKNTIKLKQNTYYFNGKIIDVVASPFTLKDTNTGFLTFDYTLFVNKGVKFDKQELTLVINELVDEIYYDYFGEPIDFDVYKDRKEFKSRPELAYWNPDDYYPGDETPTNERL